jgi:hypothetical protein
MLALVTFGFDTEAPFATISAIPERGAILISFWEEREEALTGLFWLVELLFFVKLLLDALLLDALLIADSLGS